jgi:Zn-dependent peptidase ImmA (M78 family)
VNFRDHVSSLATDREEIEANRFAAALLMPDHMVRSWVMHESFQTAQELVERLAKSFKVSKAAVNFRLVNLGLIPTPVELDHD